MRKTCIVCAAQAPATSRRMQRRNAMAGLQYTAMPAAASDGLLFALNATEPAIQLVDQDLESLRMGVEFLAA